MKALLFAIAMLISGSALAYQPSDTFVLDARVVGVHQEVYVDQSGCYGRHHGDAVLGAVVGGALGNQVGKGDGRKAATIGGALIGGLVGNHYDRRRDPSCEVERVLYVVTFEIDGQIFHTRTRTYPGNYIPVRVTMSPLVD
jgi:uncharacterized protein YcfJ